MLARIRTALLLSTALAAAVFAATPVLAQSTDRRPSTPEGLVATVYSATGGSVRWERSTDDRGAVRGYEVARDGEVLGVFDALSYVDRTLAPGRSYRYRIRAIDSGGQRSARAFVTLETLDARPSAPAALRADIYSSRTAELFWARSGVFGERYLIKRDGQEVATTDGTTYLDRTLSAARPYLFEVIALNRQGQRSPSSRLFVSTVRDGGAGGPATPPVADALAAPAGLRAAVYSRTAAEIFWERPPTPGLRYEVRRDGETLATGDATSYFDDALAGGREYRYEVVAIGPDSTRSTPSDVSLRTPGDGGSTPPVPPPAAPVLAAPTGLRVALYSGLAGELSWTRPDTPGLSYEVRRNGELLTTTDGVGYVDRTLSIGDDYRYEVIAIDRDGRRSAGSEIIVYRSDPDIPTVRTRTLSTTSVEISWSGTERPGVSYLLDRRIDSGLSFQIDEQEPPTVVVEGTTYVDEGITPGRRYRYFVVALDAEGRRSEPGRAFGSTLPEGRRFALGTLLTSPEAGFVVDGGTEPARPLGDFTGDGLADLLLPFELEPGDPRKRTGLTERAAYVVPGRAEPYPLAETRPALGIPGTFTTPAGPFGADSLSERQASRYRRGGDFNGDGIADLIGTSYDRSIGPLATVSWVIYGRPDPRSIDSVDDIGPGDGVVIDGGAFAGALGRSITFAGDLNGDGADEILLAADPTEASGPAGDSFFIVYGGPDVPARFSLDASPRVERVFRFTPSTPPPAALRGFSGNLSPIAAGDANGDGIDDLALVYTGLVASETLPVSTTLVLYGRSGSRLAPGPLDEALPAERGFRLFSTRERQLSGLGRPTPVGDLDGDGTEDFAYEDWERRFGSSLVVLNEPSPPPVRAVENLPEERRRLIEGELEPVGDLNGDGRNDLIVFPERLNTSIAGFLLYEPFASNEPLSEEALTAQPGVSLTLDDALGRTTSRAAQALGDVNGDGLDDVHLLVDVFSPEEDGTVYRGYVLYGSAAPIGTVGDR